MANITLDYSPLLSRVNQSRMSFSAVGPELKHAAGYCSNKYPAIQTRGTWLH
jgi:hypothetical protein